MKQKFTSLILTIIFSLVLCSCAAVQYGTPSSTVMGVSETITGIKSALTGTTGTFLMQRDDALLLVWPRGTQYAWTVISTAGGSRNGMTAMTNADITNVYNLTDMVQTLIARGWTDILPAAVPVKVIEVFSAYTVEAVLTGVKTLPSVFLVPMIVMPTPAQEYIN